MVSTYFLFIATIEAFKKEIDLKLTATENFQKFSMVYKKVYKYRARAGFKLNTTRSGVLFFHYLPGKSGREIPMLLNIFLDFVYL